MNFYRKNTMLAMLYNLKHKGKLCRAILRKRIVWTCEDDSKS